MLLLSGTQGHLSLWPEGEAHLRLRFEANPLGPILQVLHGHLRPQMGSGLLDTGAPQSRLPCKSKYCFPWKVNACCELLRRRWVRKVICGRVCPVGSTASDCQQHGRASACQVDLLGFLHTYICFKLEAWTGWRLPAL